MKYFILLTFTETVWDLRFSLVWLWRWLPSELFKGGGWKGAVRVRVQCDQGNLGIVVRYEIAFLSTEHTARSVHVSVAALYHVLCLTYSFSHGDFLPLCYLQWQRNYSSFRSVPMYVPRRSCQLTWPGNKSLERAAICIASTGQCVALHRLLWA